MVREWIGDGPAFEVAWGGQRWSLFLGDERPGLRVAGNQPGPLLALEGLASAGRFDPAALTGMTLVGSERRFERVEATYAPPGWGGLVVRAAWSPSGDDGMDLEVQVQASSLGELKAVEVKLVSQFADPAPTPQTSPRLASRWVEPRDARSAALSYDGREPDLRGLTTLPPREAAFHSPRLVPGPAGDGWLYAEMVHPDDVTRRIREGGRTMAQAHTTHYGLFGHDLEKGVVLRARLRALWLRSEDAKEAALDQFEQFLQAEPPLTT
ncbi:MAG TPA: hypothetical protein VGZ22_18740 [Isosphaeraceae bacterium]|jgi:hypothetical protein|nr:hypothetical protein [Isosphaeraceae bacterium]